jgi:hypothetical protein
MRFTILAPFLLASLGLVRARDDRLLYTIPAGDSMDTFTAEYAQSYISTAMTKPHVSSFETACSTWPPAIAAGLTFLDFLVEPGDFSGKNADSASSRSLVSFLFCF